MRVPFQDGDSRFDVIPRWKTDCLRKFFPTTYDIDESDGYLFSGVST